MLYAPQEDSYLLNKYVKEYAKGKVLDMGTGTGIQAKAALTKTKHVLAADINPKAVEHCKKLGINAVQSNLFSNIKEKFDLIIFNPPYLPENKDEPEDSKLATTGGKQGHEIIERFLQNAKNYLEKNGKILLVCSSLTGDVENLFIKSNYTFKLLEKQSHFFEELKVYLLF